MTVEFRVGVHLFWDFDVKLEQQVPSFENDLSLKLTNDEIPFHTKVVPILHGIFTASAAGDPADDPVD